MLLLKIGWRNIFRNKKRTVLCALAIGIGLAAIIITDAFILGMKINMIKEVTSTFLGDAQIHGRNFRHTFEVEKTINDSIKVIAQVAKDSKVKNYSTRVISHAMASSASDVNNVVLYGIDSLREREFSKLYSSLIEGNYLDQKNNQLRNNQILIGKRLAKKLDLLVGDKIVLTAAQAVSGELSQELFRVVGIFRFGYKEMDETFVFTTQKVASHILNLDYRKNQIHEIAIRYKDINQVFKLKNDYFNNLSKNGNEALSWKKLVPGIDAALSMTDYSVLIASIILFIMVSLGIVNTLFMSIYERFHEFAVIKSLGTRKLLIFKMILYEAGSLAIIGVILGLIVTLFFGLYLSFVGIDYSGIEFAQLTMTEPIYTKFKVYQFILYPIGVFFFTILVSTYPAFFAARIIPAKMIKEVGQL